VVTRVDVAVVGGGAMGSAAAWQLAKRGRTVVLLERFAPGHAHGASHGATRNFNLAYAEDEYVDLVHEARRLWDELAEETGETLLDLVGLVNHGFTGHFDAVVRAVEARGVVAERVPAEEAAARWRGIRFRSEVLLIPEAGRVRADAALRALRFSAERHGADFRYETPVESIELIGDARARVRTAYETFEAGQVIVAAGAWTTQLLGDLVTLPRLVVTQEQPAHFAVVDQDAVWPSFNHLPDPDVPVDAYWYSLVYGMLTPGEGVKAGWHAVGPVTDPDRRTYTAEPEQLAALQRYARDWLPGVDPDSCVPISCTYTLTETENFILDRVGPVVVAAGFSGHGFKFTPAVGRVLADLASGGTAPELFSLTRHLSGGPTAQPLHARRNRG
jgi:sarcosine oxidase